MCVHVTCTAVPEHMGADLDVAAAELQAVYSGCVVGFDVGVFEDQ